MTLSHNQSVPSNRCTSLIASMYCTCALTVMRACSCVINNFGYMMLFSDKMNNL